MKRKSHLSTDEIRCTVRGIRLEVVYVRVTQASFRVGRGETIEQDGQRGGDSIKIIELTLICIPLIFSV